MRELLVEKLVLKSYKAYTRLVARAYKARPTVERSALCDRSYRALIQHTERFFGKLAKRVDIEFVDDDPYANAAEMTKDIRENGRMLVSKLFSQNLLSGWSPEQNWKFRAVHDYTIHYGGSHDFSVRGEISSYNRHAKLVPAIARPALFSEVVGQAAYFEVYNSFPDPQKKCLLYGFDYDKVGLITSVDEYRKNFDPEYGARTMKGLSKRTELELLKGVRS